MSNHTRNRFYWEEGELTPQQKEEWLTVALAIEVAAAEPVGLVHKRCEDNVPDEEDGMEVILDGGEPPSRMPRQCMYCTDDE